MKTIKIKNILNKEVSPSVAWMIVIFMNFLFYKIWGFEIGVLVALWILLWYKMIIEK